jgi:hypothetical protein
MITGPVLLEDYHLVEKIANFHRERIPERIVHARGASAKGYFEVTHDITHLTCADFLRGVGVQVMITAAGQALKSSLALNSFTGTSFDCISDLWVTIDEDIR